MRRRVVWQRRAANELAVITRQDARTAERIRAAVDHYADTGYGDVQKLRGEDDLYRLRVGNFRVIFEFEDGQLVIVVLRVRNRRDAYRD